MSDRIFGRIRTDRSRRKRKIQNLKTLKTTGERKIIQEGIRTVILGKAERREIFSAEPASGEDRAIVTDIAGTTRRRTGRVLYQPAWGSH